MTLVYKNGSQCQRELSKITPFLDSRVHPSFCFSWILGRIGISEKFLISVKILRTLTFGRISRRGV